MGGKTVSLKHLGSTKKERSRITEAGFNLSQWISSSQRLMEWIDKEGVPIKEVVKLSEEDSMYAQTQCGVQGCSQSVSTAKKILGLNWNIDIDTFFFQFDWLVEFTKELSINECTVLKVVAKLYDPRGFISPLFIPIKTLFQDLCEAKIGWDDPLHEEFSLKYLQW